MYEPQIDDEYDPTTEEESLAPGRSRGCLFKIITLLVLLAFGALALPEVSYIFTKKLDFLQDNRTLQADPLVRQSQAAIVFIEAVDTSQPLHTARHQGSGFNIDPSGIIITNRHVVEPSSLIIISFADGRRFYTRQYNPIPGEDLAVIRIDSRDLPVLELETDSWAEPGDTVTVIGNPLGFSHISQRGEVRQLRRLGSSLYPLLEIELPIQPGSSGSPVLNEAGRVVGIIFASAHNMNTSSQDIRGLAISAAVLQFENDAEGHWPTR